MMICTKMKRLIVVCFLSLCFLPGALSPKPAQAGKDPYPELIDYIAHEVRGILKKHGMPILNDRANPWPKFSGVPGDYYIDFYQSDEIPPAAISDTIRFCMDLYKIKGRKENFRIRMYRESFENTRKLFSGVEPFFELILNGEK